MPFLDERSAVEPSKEAHGPLWARALVALPDRLSLILLALFLVASALVTFGILHPWLLVPIFVLVVAALWRFAPVSLPTSRGNILGSAGALLVSVVWTVANVPFASQYLNPVRDPGLYTLAGIGLIKSPSAGIDVSQVQKLLQGLSGFEANFGPFVPDANGVIHLQGGDLLPALLGIAGWVGGTRGALVVNILLGGAALLAVYALGRRLLGPIWALAPQIALGLSIAWLFFSRAPYSEIIMVTVCAAGLVSLISAVKTGRKSDYAVAGLFIGSASMARIDGPIAIIGVMVMLSALAVGIGFRGERKPLLVGGLVLALASVISTLFGIIDLTVNKPNYLYSHNTQTYALWAATLGTIVVFPVFWWIGGRVIPRLSRKVLTRVAWIASTVTAVLLLGWLSRPLWYVGHFQSAAQMNAVQLLQQAEGLPVDPTRSYEEQTFSWMGWYFGWPMVGLAIIGCTLLIFLGVKRRVFAPLLLVGTAIAAALLYFDQVSITPDQVWAFRRLLPLITPGLLIAALVVSALLWSTKKLWWRIAAVVAAAAVAFGPLATYNGLVIVKEYGNQYSEVKAICNAITTKTVLFVRDHAPTYYGMALKTVCGVNVVSMNGDEVSTADLVALEKRAGKIDVVLYDIDQIKGSHSLGDPLITVTVPTWSTAISHLPDHIVSTTRAVWIGALQPDGSVAKIQR